MYKRAFERLPERFRKTNTEKLYYVLYNDSKDLKQAFDSVRDSRNIDKAEGETLDLIGANVGQFRIDEDDELYRLLIKIKIIANLSNGDIPTINKVMMAVFKDKFLGLQEVWTLGSYRREPAAIKLRLGVIDKNIPYQIIDRIKAAGVRIIIELNYKTNFYIGAGSTAGEVITILPPPLEDIVIKHNNSVFGTMYTIHEEIIIEGAKI